MGTPLKVKLFNAASANAGLQALLGTSPFRWYDTQLPQTATFPCVVAFLVSDPRDYEARGQMSTSWNRVQLTVFGTGNDSTEASAVVAAVLTFVRGFFAYNAGASATQSANKVVSDRDGGIAETQPLTYQRFLDVMFLNDESL